MTIITSMRHSLTTTHTSAHADTHDYNMDRLQTWNTAGLRADLHPLTEDTLLASALSLSAARQDRNFTEWDGNLSAAGANFAGILGNRPLSPTSLERWAKCPFSYFLGTILRLSAEDRPEDIYAITPMERGSLVHDILEKFVNTVRAQNSLPATTEAWSKNHHRELRRIANEHFEEAEARGVTGKSVMWQIARDEILIDLSAFLDADLRMRQQFGVSPIGVEAEFGMSNEGWQPAAFTLSDDSQVKFRGKIDRVDADDSGKRTLVLDYKTGSDYSYRKLKDDPIDRGQRLQLAIYALAAKQALGDDTSVSAAYWFVTGKGNFALMPAQPVNIGDDGVLSRFDEGISTIVGGIRQGLFPANPGEPDRGSFANCRFCDFKTLCPSRRDVQWRRKSQASALSEYVRLTDGE